MCPDTNNAEALVSIGVEVLPVSLAARLRRRAASCPSPTAPRAHGDAAVTARVAFRQLAAAK